MYIFLLLYSISSIRLCLPSVVLYRVFSSRSHSFSTIAAKCNYTFFIWHRESWYPLPFYSMFSRMIIGVLSASVLFSHRSSALVARGAPASSSWPTLKFTTTVYSGIATASGYPGVQRDGTGGGQVSGHNIMAFSDTQTPKDGPTGYSWYAHVRSSCFLLWTALLVARHFWGTIYSQ